MGSPRATLWIRGLAVLYVGAAAFFFIGFATHRSSVGVIGPYTPGYLAFLLVLAGGLLLPLGVLFLLSRILGAGRVIRAAAKGILLLLLFYGAAEVIHAAVRSHPFDPFLQFPGTRFEDIARTPAEGVTRIVTLGGSTTHNAHLEPELRYPAVLEDLLNEAGGSYEILNAGMDWWTTKHSHINYVTYVRSWQPEVVVVMHAINDLYRSFSGPRFSVGDYDPQWAHFYGPAIRGAKPKTLFGATMDRWSVWEFNRRWYAAWRYQEADLGLDAYRSLPEFEVSLRSLVRTLTADGVQVVLVTQPSLYREGLGARERGNLWFPSTFCVIPEGIWARTIPSVPSMSLAMEAFNEVVRRVGEEEGTDVVDAANRMPRTLEYFGDDVHYTAAGANLLATEIFGALQGASENRLSDESPGGLR